MLSNMKRAQEALNDLEESKERLTQQLIGCDDSLFAEFLLTRLNANKTLIENQCKKIYALQSNSNKFLNIYLDKLISLEFSCKGLREFSLLKSSDDNSCVITYLTDQSVNSYLREIDNFSYLNFFVVFEGGEKEIETIKGIQDGCIEYKA